MPKNKDYDKKLYRLVRLLNILESDRKVSTSWMAKEFNVTIRTAQRDLELINGAGFPIMPIGKGLYAFVEGFSLKNIPVSDEEASMLVFLCDVAKTLGRNFQEPYQRIFSKVIKTQPWDSPYFAIVPRATKETVSPFQKTLERAIDEARSLDISYPGENGPRVLKTQPLKILFYEGLWYLLAKAAGKRGIIKLRIDKMLDVQPRGESFRVPGNLAKALASATSIWFGDKRDIHALLRIAPEAAENFCQKIFFPIQKVEKKNRDGSILVSAKLHHLMEAVPEILRWIPYISVIKPAGLKEEVSRRVKAYREGL